MKMLTVEKINSYYGEGHVLDNVSLDVEEGQIVALFGRNGVGKTTTLRSIMGLKPPACAGKILFKDQDISDLPPFKRALMGLGFVPENRAIFPNLTTRQNLEVGKKTGGKTNGEKAAVWDFDKVFNLFPKLKDLQNSMGRNLSGGEQQMLTIGRSLMGNPELLLLDEPTEGLAPLIARDVANMVLQLKEEYGLSILIVEQFSTRVLEYADICYVMDRGKVVFTGTPEEIKKDEKLQHELLGVTG